MSRLDQYQISVTLDNVDYGVWDKMSGGQVDSEETKYKPGGMGLEVNLGGTKTLENVTVSRLFKLDRDLTLVPNLMARVGKGKVVVVKQSLDVDGNATGKPQTYKGTLKRVTPPDADSEGSGAALIELEISTSGLPS